MKIGIYTRVSTDEQSVNGISLDNQAARGKEMALKIGYDYKVFNDSGLSGKIPFDKRPALNSLLNEIIEKKINAIFVTDLDRLSRGDIIQTTLIKNIIKENDAKLYDISGSIDLNDPNQELLTDIRSLLAAYEIKKTSGRIKTVLEQNAQNNKAWGGPLLAFGYTKDANKYLIIDEEERKVVELIYQLAIEGKGSKSIATILNEKKILTKRGRSKTGNTLMVKGKRKTTFLWRDSTVYRILTNPMYKGERLYKDKTYQCPAIVDKRLFKLVEEKLATRNQFKDTTNKHTYMLKGLIKCPVCNGKFYGKKRDNGKKDNAYVCNSQRYEFCGNVGINIDYLDNLVLENIANLNTLVKGVFEKVRNDKFYKSQTYHLDTIKQKLKDTNDGINNLLDITQKAGIEPAQFKVRFQSLNKKLENLKAEEILASKNLGIVKEEAIVTEFVKKIVSDFKKVKTVDEKIMYIRNLVQSISVRWEQDELKHWVSINFRIDKLQDYILSKEISVNRTGTTINKKRITKVITEEIKITNVVGFIKKDIPFVKYQS